MHSEDLVHSQGQNGMSGSHLYKSKLGKAARQFSDILYNPTMAVKPRGSSLDLVFTPDNSKLLFLGSFTFAFYSVNAFPPVSIYSQQNVTFSQACLSRVPIVVSYPASLLPNGLFPFGNPIIQKHDANHDVPRDHLQLAHE